MSRADHYVGRDDVQRHAPAGSRASGIEHRTGRSLTPRLVGTYRQLEAGERAPSWETWDRICKLFGWGQTFIGSTSKPQ
jgi:hypothetical protein